MYKHNEEVRQDLLNKYVELGWKIFPVHPTKKVPLTEDGFYSATSDITTIDAWKERFPGCGWAVRTGDSDEGSGRVVVDLDRKNGKNGYGEFQALVNQYGDSYDEITMTSYTPNDGIHLHYEYPQGLDLRNRTGIYDGIDIRANGGYAVIPPTPGYVWEVGVSSDQADVFQSTKLEPMPSWLLNQLTKRAPTAPTVPVGELIPIGMRNSFIFKQAYSMRANSFSKAEVIAAIRTMVEDRVEDAKSYTEREMLASIESAFKYDPRHYARTDIGNARRFISQHGTMALYSEGQSQWFMWDGKRWNPNAMGHVTKLAQYTAESILDEAKIEKDEHERKALLQHAIRTQEARNIRDMLSQAWPHLVMDVEKLDQDPWLLNVANGALDLRTGTLYDHRPEMMISKLTNIPYVKNAQAPRWQAFMELVTADDEELQQYLQKAVGYSLTGLTDEHCIFFLYGTGANGKSTFSRALRPLLGDFYAKSDADALLREYRKRNPESPKPNIARLKGVRMAFTSELGDGVKLAETQIKDLSGGDPITARMLHKNPIEFLPSHKIWIYGNYKPKIVGDDEGIWRRIRIVPFRKTIEESIRRPMSEVLQEFELEAEGILNWAIEGCLLWQQEGLEMPSSVAHATQDYKQEQDVFQQFLDDKVYFDPQETVSKAALFKAWASWCEENNEWYKKSKRWTTAQMIKRGCFHEDHNTRHAKLRGATLRNS